jgi:hypothetical protein
MVAMLKGRERAVHDCPVCACLLDVVS